MKVRICIPYVYSGSGISFRDIELSVDEKSPVENVKREMPQSLEKLDHKHYVTHFGGKSVTVEPLAPLSSQICLMREMIPSVERRLDQFGIKLEDHGLPIEAAVHLEHRVFGYPNRVSEAAETYVMLLRQTRLENSLPLADQQVKDGDRLFPSIDIEYAIRCVDCNQEMQKDLLYYPAGFYDLSPPDTTLAVRCPSCHKHRTIGSYGSFVHAINDELQKTISACRLRSAGRIHF